MLIWTDHNRSYFTFGQAPFVYYLRASLCPEAYHLSDWHVFDPRLLDPPLTLFTTTRSRSVGREGRGHQDRHSMFYPWWPNRIGGSAERARPKRQPYFSCLFC